MTTEEEKREQDQYDNPWKDILNRYLPECLEFFFPLVAQQIDWSKGYEFLDVGLRTQLQVPHCQVTRLQG